jgi:hypothetical protein
VSKPQKSKRERGIKNFVNMGLQPKQQMWVDRVSIQYRDRWWDNTTHAHTKQDGE